jgi:hypothetical protein
MRIAKPISNDVDLLKETTTSGGEKPEDEERSAYFEILGDFHRGIVDGAEKLYRRILSSEEFARRVA